MSPSSCHHLSLTIFIHCIVLLPVIVDMLCCCSPNLLCFETFCLCDYFSTPVRPNFVAVHLHGNYGKKIARTICLSFKSVFFIGPTYGHLCQKNQHGPFYLNPLIFVLVSLYGTFPYITHQQPAPTVFLLSDMFFFCISSHIFGFLFFVFAPLVSYHAGSRKNI